MIKRLLDGDLSPGELALWAIIGIAIGTVIGMYVLPLIDPTGG